MRSFSAKPATVSVRATRACAVLLPPVAGASAHTTSERPTLSTSPGAMAFQLASARTSTPYARAIDHRLSPARTTCSLRTPLRGRVLLALRAQLRALRVARERLHGVRDHQVIAGAQRVALAGELTSRITADRGVVLVRDARRSSRPC